MFTIKTALNGSSQVGWTWGENIAFSALACMQGTQFFSPCILATCEEPFSATLYNSPRRGDRWRPRSRALARGRRSGPPAARRSVWTNRLYTWTFEHLNLKYGNPVCSNWTHLRHGDEEGQQPHQRHEAQHLARSQGAVSGRNGGFYGISFY